MTGTILNIITILVGGFTGMFFGGRLPERVRHTVVAGLGLFTALIGVKMFAGSANEIIVLLSILFGGVLGEFLHIEDGLRGLGGWLEARFNRQQSPDEPASGRERFVRGFLTASLLFITGPMAILGSVQDGLSGDFKLLAIKSVLDGFAALAFASTLGVGVLFSTVVVLLYQGGITLAAAQVQSLVSEPMMVEMTAAGGVLLVGLAISSLLEIKPIRVGNFLPALVFAPLLVALSPWLEKLWALIKF